MAKIIIVFNTKGGVGKTLIAANLAVALSTDRRVCLMDLDFRGAGDISKMLGLKPQKTMLDYLDALKDKSAAPKKEDFFTPFSKTLDFIPAILKPGYTPHLELIRLKDAFSSIDKEYDYIVIDCGVSFNDVLVNVLNQANLILLVVTPDILSVHQAKWTMDTLQSLHFPLKMVRLVINRAESASSISWQEINVALSCEIIAMIPSEGRAALEALNRGVPVVKNSPRGKITASINKLAQDILFNPDLFVGHAQIEIIPPPESAMEKTGEFWKRSEFAGPAPRVEKEKESGVTVLKRDIHERLIQELNIKRVNLGTDAELRKRAEAIVTNILAEEGKFVSSQNARSELIKDIIDEALALGPLEDLLKDESISDIMVNNKDEIYIERGGRIELTSKKFISNDQIKTVIERIIAPIGRRIDESMPLVDARLSDGSRVNAIIPPLSLTGPTLTIRKFRKEKFRAEELVKSGTLSEAMLEFLKACVLTRKNIIISGGTGSGKTTVLNLFSGFIPEEERIITIEDAAELKLDQEHWVRLESRPPNIEGKGAITIRDLFRNTLRMRPDRILVGECRGMEALDMLQAMNTGHDGSMTTIHANSTQDVIMRLDAMILMSGVELPIRAIREMVSSAIDIIVHTARLTDGSRKITQISELTGMLDETHINLKYIFLFRHTGLDANRNIIGAFQPTGYIPSFTEDIRKRGIKLSDEIFKS